MHIAFFELEQWEKEYFEKNLPSDVSKTFFEEPLDNKILEKISDVEFLVVFIYSHITVDVLDKLPSLKAIATMSTGTDHIDLEACKKRNITVMNVPTYGEHTVAEHTFALMLCLSRKILESYKKIKEWCFTPSGLTGFDLAGKTLGVIGIGNIGKNVIKIAKGFDMNVIGYKRSPDPDLEKTLGFKIVDMDTLLQESDIITLHVPYTKETHHLLDTSSFEKMKKGVMIINTARGAIINTYALIQAIKSEKVAYAGLDVLEGEPLLREERELLSKNYNQADLVCILENHMLLSFPNVIVTPHNAFNSREALEKILEVTRENISGILSEKPINVL